MFTEKIITAKDVARLLHKSLQWVYRNAVSLGGIRIGRSVIFTEESLIAALESARERSRQEQEQQACRTPIEPREKPAPKRKNPGHGKTIGHEPDPYGLLQKTVKPLPRPGPGSTIEGRAKG